LTTSHISYKQNEFTSQHQSPIRCVHN